MPYSPMELANAFLKAGELSDALDALNMHLIEHTQDESALRLRAGVYCRLEGQEYLLKARDDVENIADLLPEDFILYSVVLFQLQQHKEAVQIMQRGYLQYPENERLAERLIYLLQETGATSQAKQFIETVLIKESNSWRWRQWAGDIAAHAGESSSAVMHYTAALNILSEHYAIDSSRAATVLNDTGISEAAALTVMGSYARLLLVRAEAYQQQNQLDKADQDYATAQNLIPHDPIISFNRGLLAAQRGNLQQARTFCEDAIKNAPSTLIATMQTAIRADPRYASLLTLL